MIGNTFLHQIVNENKEYQPSKILDLLREKVILALNQQGEDKARKDGMDMALCCLNKETLELQYAGANNPLYLVHKGEMKEIKPDKQPVGYMPERPEKFQNHSLQLEKGDAVYIFSDGYADQFGGPKGKKFKYKQLRELLLGIHQKTMPDQKQELITVFNDWKGGLEQIDDVCVVGVRI
jgi:serine phosphatase RsbU (regulator of sigma subunit)